MNDTGETTKRINARMDDAAWVKVEKSLSEGAYLKRPNKLETYFAFKDGDYFGPSITKTLVRKLVEEGKLTLVGVETYSLSSGY